MLDFLCKESYDLRDFVALITFLRSPDGCPWDQVQTHESIRRNFLEETYEVCEAIDAGDTAHLKEELGDVLMQVLFHTDIEREAGHFDIDDVADAACKKLIYRHPHVFRRDEPDAPDWDTIKQRERAQTTTAEAMDSVARSLPALWRCEKIQAKAAKTGFEWPDTDAALDKVEEETRELREAVASCNADAVAEELGEDIGSVFKTLVLRGDRTGHFVCVVPADHEVDLKAAARVSGNKKADLIPMKELLPVTGYIRGGCSPIGMKKQFPTYIHSSAASLPAIYISAGVRGLQLKIAPAELIAFVGATVAEISRRE